MSYTKIEHYEKEYLDTHHDSALNVTEGVDDKPVVNPHFVRRKRRVMTTDEYVEGLLSVTGATCIANLLFTFCLSAKYSAPHLILHILMTVLLYLLLLFFIGGFRRADIRWLIDSLLPKESLPHLLRRLRRQ